MNTHTHTHTHTHIYIYINALILKLLENCQTLFLYMSVYICVVV